MQACDMVLKRLKADSPTRRIAWISAASIADKTNMIKTKITEQSDEEFLEIYQRNFAHIINQFILEKPPKYFYGIDNAKNLDDAFVHCGFDQTNKVVGRLVPDIPRLSYVDENSIESIMALSKGTWEAEVKYTYNNDKEFLSVVMFNYPKLYDYLIHLRKGKKNLEKIVHTVDIA